MVHADRTSRGWQAGFTTALVLTTLSLGGIVASLRSLERNAPRGLSELETIERRVHGFGSRLEQLKERQYLGEWIQREMRRANPRLEVVAARGYSRLLLDVTDKYGSVDPLFLLAVGIVESHFDTRATSHANAKGLYQIWPATGRWLAGELGWELSEAMLYEPARNTELAALYLDKLFERYGDPRLVLAEYNGGPINARRLRNGSDRLAAETRDYVVRVMGVVDGLNRRLDVALAEKPHEPVRLAGLETLVKSGTLSD